MFPGLSSRVEKDLRAIYLKDKFGGDVSGFNRIKINVVDPPRRKHGVFIGASFLANLSGEERWVSLKDWKEQGERIFLK